MKNKLCSKKFLLPLFFLIFCSPAFSFSVSYEDAFSLTPLNEGLELGFGALLTGSAFVCDKFVDFKKNDYKAEDWKFTDLPDIDAFFSRPYSKPLHIVGTGTMALSMLAPAMFAVLPSSEWLTVGTMYAETLLFANGIKEWLKLLVYRARPYMYYEGYPQKKLADGDWNCSFPSGHTTLAFAGAAFTTMLYCQYFPDSKWKYAVAGASFGTAALTGALRIASGNHFFTDVITGAFIGTLCGIAVPYMHTKTFYSNHSKKKGSVNASFMPYGINLRLNF